MDQNKEPTNGFTYIWSIDLQQGYQQYTMDRDSHVNKLHWENWIATCQRMKLNPHLTPGRKVNLKTNIRFATIKLTEESIWKKHHGTELSNNLIGMTP